MAKISEENGKNISNSDEQNVRATRFEQPLSYLCNRTSLQLVAETSLRCLTSYCEHFVNRAFTQLAIWQFISVVSSLQLFFIIVFNIVPIVSKVSILARLTDSNFKSVKSL